MTIKNILVVRNDKLGDFMLAWPALALIKNQFPEAKISVLVPGYTRPMAELCPSIDNILIDDNRENSYSGGLALSKTIKSGQFDAAITLFSEFRTGFALWLCRIPVRVAPASKIAQIFYNYRLTQRRSRSEKPEYQYNLDLAKYFIKHQGIKNFPDPEPPYLAFDNTTIQLLRNDFLAGNGCAKNTRLIFVHPGSGGSANNLSLQQYADLIAELAEQTNNHFVLTAGPDEIEVAQQLSSKLDGIQHTVYHSTKGLVDFSRFIAMCDLFISGSTGPLHVAGALNKATAAFYPARRSATALRWKTLNQDDRQIAFMPEPGENETDMSGINVKYCARRITEKLLRQ